MITRTNTFLVSALMSALSLSGCGGAGSTATDTLSYVDVERGPVLYSHVIDAAGVKGTAVAGTAGLYAFNGEPHFPITSTGGYIDIDSSNSLTVGDIPLGNLQFKAQGAKITIASTLAENSNALALLEENGFTEEQLLTETPSTDKAIAALSDEIFKYIHLNPDADLATLVISADLMTDINTRVTAYTASADSAIELEQALILEINNESETGVDTVDAGELDALSGASEAELTQSSFEAMPVTPETLELIAFSWNEEKMAKDLYFNLYAATGSSINALNNVATNSETKHQEIMRELAEKYNLNISAFDPAETDVNKLLGYADSTHADVASGEFPLTEVQEMYDELWAHYIEGGATNVSALEAACIVEVKDVADLNASIAEAYELNAYELVAAFESLRSGSYSHYWAFNNALIKEGVTTGCGSLGEEYAMQSTDSTAANYFPQVTKGKGGH